MSHGTRKIRTRVTIAGIALLIAAVIWIFALAHPMH
jgi:hypothetical protein